MLALLLCICGPTVAYDNESLPRMMQTMVSNGRSPFGMGFRPATINTAAPGGHGRLSNPNWHERWRQPEGTADVENLSVRRWLHVPDGQWVEVWRQTERHEGEVYLNLVRWRFPPGTVAIERLYVDSEKWLTRRRTKQADGSWEPDVESHRKDPPGYRPTSLACADCHRDAGRHVSQLEGHARISRQIPGHSWYGMLSGGGGEGEDDAKGWGGVISWRPVNSRGEIWPQYRSFVRWRR